MSETRDTARVVATQVARPRSRPNRARAVVWFAIALLGLLVASHLAEDRGIPNFTPNYDLSSAVIATLGAMLALTGLVIVIAAIRKGERAVRRALSDTSLDATRARAALAARRRAGWLMAFGWLMVIIGAVLFLVRIRAFT